MRRFMTRSRWAAAFAAVGTCLPANGWTQEAAANVPAATAEAERPIRDVALTQSGTFSGRVIDDAGKPLDGVVVRLARA